jgi:hypothetical protein
MVQLLLSESKAPNSNFWKFETDICRKRAQRSFYLSHLTTEITDLISLKVIRDVTQGSGIVIKTVNVPPFCHNEKHKILTLRP